MTHGPNNRDKKTVAKFMLAVHGTAMDIDIHPPTAAIQVIRWAGHQMRLLFHENMTPGEYKSMERDLVRELRAALREDREPRNWDGDDDG